MKLLFFICLLFAAIYCQTSINIYNNGNGCNSPCPSTPTAPRRYRIGLAANKNYLFYWDSTVIQSILQLVPSLRDKIDVIPILYTNFTQDILLPTASCFYDAVISDTGITQQRLDLGLKFTEEPYFSLNKAIYTFYVNVPKSATNSTLCALECNQAGVCSNYTVEDLYNYANANGKTTINLRYEAGTYRQQVMQDLQQQFKTLGYTGSFNLYGYPANEDPVKYALNAAADTLEVVTVGGYTSVSCPAIKNQTSTVSVAPLVSNINPGAGFPVCPKSTDLLDLLNSGISQYKASADYCGDLETYLGWCFNDPPIFNEVQDPCYGKISVTC